MQRIGISTIPGNNGQVHDVIVVDPQPQAMADSFAADLLASVLGAKQLLVQVTVRGPHVHIVLTSAVNARRELVATGELRAFVTILPQS